MISASFHAGFKPILLLWLSHFLFVLLLSLLFVKLLTFSG